MKHLLAKIRGYQFRLRCQLWGKRIDIGKGLRIYKRLDIRGKGLVTIGENCTIAGVLGDNEQFVTIYTVNPEAKVNIGDNASLYAGRISCRFSVTIGNDILLEESGIADTDFHVLGRSREIPSLETSEKCRIVIGNRVSIGSRSIVTKGVTIGDDTVVGPGSIVSRSLGIGIFAIGNPAKPVIDHLITKKD